MPSKCRKKRSEHNSRLSFPLCHYGTKCVVGCVMFYVPHISCHSSFLPIHLFLTFMLGLSRSLSSFVSSLSQSFLPVFTPQELPGFHAHEVHPVQRRQVRARTEQPSLWHHPRSHPLLHHTQTPDPRCRAPVPAVPRAGADTLTDPDAPVGFHCDRTRKTWMFDGIFPAECQFSLLVGLHCFWWFNTPGAHALTHHCCCTCAKCL